MANVTVIPEDYDGLKKEYLVLRKELDSANQELYGCKRQLKILEALQQEYQSEIEILQSEENTGKQKYEDKIAQLEENISNVRLKCNEQVQVLEADLSIKEGENLALQAEIELLKKVNSAQIPTEDSSKLFEEVVTLKQEKETLLENEDELKFTIENLEKKYLSLEETLMEHRAELSNLKENLSCKREELIEANDLIQKLNDEIYCVKTELESYKSKPLNAESKGNSLFAEVDDRRVYLQKTINSMKSEYISMKQERAKHLNLISHLRKENKELCDRWKADTEEKEEDQDAVLKAYKDRIHVFENLIDKYKRDLSAKPMVFSTGSFSEIEFYQAMFNNKVKELEELRSQISARGLTQVMLSISLKEANKEVRKWRLETKLRQCQLDLKAGDLLTNNVTEKVKDVKERHVALKEIKKEDKSPGGKAEEKLFDLCKKYVEQNESKEIITVYDSSVSDFEDNLDVKQKFGKNSSGVKEKRSPAVGNLVDLGESVVEVKVESDDKASGKIVDALEEKENVSDNVGKMSRRVTFSQNTTSPKVTDRTAMKRNCRRIEVPKPMYFPSE